MDELLAALGRRSNTYNRAWLIGIFGAFTVALLVAGQVTGIYAQRMAVALHLSSWFVWFAWQSWLFPRHRERYLHDGPTTAYRQAFYRDILPGVSFGVAQMLRPVFCAVLSSVPGFGLAYRLPFGIGLTAFGAVLLYFGFRTIGIASAGFLFEYTSARKALVKRGVYAHIRHPLFLGGVATSFGLTLLFADFWALALAACNIAVLPIYSCLEDARLVRVFGGQYVEYKSAVGGLVPRRIPSYEVESFPEATVRIVQCDERARSSPEL